MCVCTNTVQSGLECSRVGLSLWEALVEMFYCMHATQCSEYNRALTRLAGDGWPMPWHNWHYG